MNVIFKRIYYNIICYGLYFKNISKKRKKSDYKKRDIVVIANGTSLKEVDIYKLSEEYDIVCVNSYPVYHNEFWDCKIKYIALFDPDYYIGAKSDVLKKKVDELINCLKKVDWPLTVICYENQILPIDNQYISYNHISRNIITPDTGINHSMLFELYDCNIISVGAQTVTNGALFWAIQNNYENIYVIGFDMDFIFNMYVNENNNIIWNDIHDSGAMIRNMSEEGMYKKGEFYTEFESVALVLKECLWLEMYSKSKGSKIINWSMKSYVDVFEKHKVEATYVKKDDNYLSKY